MTNVKSYTTDQLIQRVESLPSFKGWKKGKYDIIVRSEENAFDKFDDKAYSMECLKDGERPIFHFVQPITSNAGKEGLKHFEKYNPKGCAVLQSDIIVYDSHVYGLHKGKPAYIQSFTVPYPYFRDNDKDDLAEEVGKLYYDRIGANCHRAGQNSVLIGGWSVACLVRPNLDQFLAWLKHMNKEPLTVAILKEW